MRNEKKVRDGGARPPIVPGTIYWLRELPGLFGLSKSTVSEARKAGLLQVYRGGHGYFTWGEDLLAWLKGLRVGREGPGLLANGNGHPL